MRIFHTFLLLCLSVLLYAVPAKRHTVRALMNNGVYETLIFCGDENRSFYLTTDGYIAQLDKSGAFYVKTNQKPSDIALKKNVIYSRGIGALEGAPIKSIGSPNIPVIIVNFSDLSISVADSDDAINKYISIWLC